MVPEEGQPHAGRRGQRETSLPVWAAARAAFPVRPGAGRGLSARMPAALLGVTGHGACPLPASQGASQGRPRAAGKPC